MLTPRFHLRSTALGNERPIWILPPRDPARAQHLVIFLDGEWYLERVEVPELLAALQPNLPDAWYTFVSVQSSEARWTECPCHPPFATFVVDEVLPALSAEVPALANARFRTLVGLSYTGLAAAFVAYQYPETFDHVVCQSGSFWWNDGWLIEQFARTRTRGRTTFHLSVGRRETQSPLEHREGVVQRTSQLEAVRGLRDALERTDRSVTYQEYDGAHDFTLWKTSLPDGLRAALGASTPIGRSA